MTDIHKIEKEIENGGKWLGALRSWLQWNVSDTLEWNSAKTVEIPFCKFSELGKTDAAAAIMRDRQVNQKLLKEAYERFKKYEMDVDSDAPSDHLRFMKKLKYKIESF